MPGGVKRPLAWLLLACVIGTAIGLGFALAARPVSVLNVLVMGGLTVANAILLVATRGQLWAGGPPSKAQLLVAQAGLVGFLAFGLYVLLRGRQPWPGALLLVVGAVVAGFLIVGTRRASRKR
jgi:hypothetical protein